MPNKFENHFEFDPKTIIKFKGRDTQIIKKFLSKSARQEFLVNKKYKLAKLDKRHRILVLVGKLLNPDWVKKTLYD